MTEIPRTGNFYVQLGEQEGIGASCGLLSYMGQKILLDAGTSFKRAKGFPIQKVVLPAGNGLAGMYIDLIICSHAHQDHSGFLPKVIALHPEATVIMPRQCFEILKVMYPDSLKISNQETEKALDLGYEPPICSFTLENMEFFFALEGTPTLILLDNERSHNLPGLYQWRFKFQQSGHTVGAVSTFIEAPDGWTCYWTSDTASHNQEICSGVLVPEGWKHPDVIITEATNGSRPMKDTREETWTKFEKIILNTHASGGHVLCPAFAVNRLSNVAIKATKLGERMGFVTVLDGLATRGKLGNGLGAEPHKVGERIVDIEMGTEKVEDLIRRGLLILIDQTDAKKIGVPQRQKILDGEFGPAVIISSSATMENGWSAFWAKNLLPERKNSVILTGYVFPDSVAEQALHKGGNLAIEYYNKKWRKMIKQPVNCACEVHSLSLSAHDYQQGLIQRILVAKPKMTIVHHASTESYGAYNEALRSEFARLALNPPSVVRGEHGVVINL